MRIADAFLRLLLLVASIWLGGAFIASFQMGAYMDSLALFVATILCVFFCLENGHDPHL